MSGWSKKGEVEVLRIKAKSILFNDSVIVVELEDEDEINRIAEMYREDIIELPDMKVVIVEQKAFIYKNRDERGG